MSDILSTINVKGTNTSLKQHLQDILKFIVTHEVENPMESFFQISEYVKSGEKSFLPPENRPLELDDGKKKFPKYRYKRERDNKKLERNLNYLRLNSLLSGLVGESEINEKVEKDKEEEDDDMTESEEEPEEEVSDEEGAGGGGIPDLFENATLFSDCGIGLDEVELNILNLSLSRLQKLRGFLSVRFFGKVYGTEKDYYILEALEKTDSEEEDSESSGEESEEDDEKLDAKKETAKKKKNIPPEINGKGSNKYKYYVCNNLNGEMFNLDSLKIQEKIEENEESDSEEKIKPTKENNNERVRDFVVEKIWTLLPDVTPEQILCTRKIKKFFTGNLEASVKSHPPFPGLEKNYLRAQLSRIANSTVICPLGLFIKEDEDSETEEDEEGSLQKPIKEEVQIEAYTELPEIVQNQEFGASDEYKVLDLTKLENWVHLYYPILQTQGRCQSLHEVKEEDENNDESSEEEDDGTKEEKKVEYEPEQIWPILSSVKNDSQVYKGVSSWVMREVSTSNNHVLLKSLRWPGAFSVGKKDTYGLKFANIYLGNGLKFDRNPFSPQEIDDVQLVVQEKEVMMDPCFEETLEYERK